MTSQTINLNLIPGAIEPIIHVSQYDKGQTWTFNLFEGSQPFNIPSGATVLIQGTKADKTGFQYSCSFNNNVVTAIEQQQMTVLAGKVPAEIVITKGDELIGSINICIMVEPAALADDTVISETDLPLIEEAVEALSHIDDTLAEMKGYKEDSEAYAIGKRNGSDVGSSDPAYHNNSKYYAGQASSSASSASGSATSAGTNALISEGYAVGKQNGSAVGSGSPYYQNNAEYYKGQAANSATNAGNSANAASGSATTASNKALVAEGYADGKQNGTDVGSGSPYYHNNSKYYADQAAASAQSAAQSAASLTVDSALSPTSTNPVQNKVINSELSSVKQALSDEIITRATLGTSNLDMPINEEFYNVTYSRSNNGYQVTSTASSTWTNVCFYYKLPKNKDLKILTNVSHSAGNPRIAVYGNSIPSETGRTNITTKEISADGAVEVSFNTGNYEYIAIALFASINIAAQGNVTYSNFIIKLSNDPNTSYTEPAMTNKELTDARFLNGTVTQVANANFTDSAEYTIPSDGCYYLWLQINEVAAGKGLAIKLGSGAGASAISTLRTAGQAYEGANAIIPLKAGTIVTFACSESTLSCQYNVKKIS